MCPHKRISTQLCVRVSNVCITHVHARLSFVDFFQMHGSGSIATCLHCRLNNTNRTQTRLNNTNRTQTQTQISVHGTKSPCRWNRIKHGIHCESGLGVTQQSIRDAVELSVLPRSSRASATPSSLISMIAQQSSRDAVELSVLPRVLLLIV